MCVLDCVLTRMNGQRRHRALGEKNGGFTAVAGPADSLPQKRSMREILA